MNWLLYGDNNMTDDFNDKPFTCVQRYIIEWKLNCLCRLLVLYLNIILVHNKKYTLI